MSIYKACDIRGEFGQELTVEHARKLGLALRALKGSVPILVGGDGRVSTPALKEALIAALRQGGEVIDLGQIPTAMFYFARATLRVEVGVVVTASHNPARDNGFKITLDRLPITPEEMQRLSGLMESDLSASLAGGTSGRVRKVDLRSAYLDSIANFIPDLRGWKVVIDCANGMAGLVARRVWERSGAQVKYLLEEVDGRFPSHPPNPADPRTLELLQSTVLEQGADLGIAYDGDADRVAFVDPRGRAVPNDQVIALFARWMLQQGPDTVIYDQKCSQLVPDTIRSLGGEPVMEISGHTFIKRVFLNRRAVYAGELSGHHFIRAVGGDDGVAASLIFAGYVKSGGQRLDELVDQLPVYAITPDIRLAMTPQEIERLLADLATNLADRARLVRTDGLRIEFTNGWGLVRSSVTEPVVTMRFEGVHAKALHEIMLQVDQASSLLRGRLIDP